MALYEYFMNNSGKMIHKWTHYFPAYERHFERFVNRPVLMFEIGVFRGGSSEMWKNYFGPYSQIVGIDINPDCKEFQSDQVEIRIGDQSDEAFMTSLVAEFGQPDIVLDDGSHNMIDLTSTFGFLYPLTSPNGVYFVEDLHTCYWPEYGGGLQNPDSFIELTKSLIDELNADHSRGKLPPTQFTRTTTGIHIYDSCIAFERGKYALKKDLQR